MRKLSDKQNKIHKRAVKLARIHTRAERHLVETLIQVEAEKIHKALDRKSMFLYAVKELKLSDCVALMLIGVARRCKIVPALRYAVANGQLTPSMASRVVAHINLENAEEIIQFASSHTQRETDYEMARRNPKAAAKDQVKPLSEDAFQIQATISKAGLTNLKRAQSLLAQKNKLSSQGSAIEAALDRYLNTEDPVRKAKRAQAKKVCLHRVKTQGTKSAEQTQTPHFERIPLSAAQEHAVNARDEGRCTHPDPEGKRCNSDRWTAIHHIIPVSMGGTNDLENLTTLCSFHHDLVHQLSLGLEGDVNWLR